MFPEGMDLNALLEQAQAMQSQFAEAQNRLSETAVKGTAGGGLVEATLTGTGELVGLMIKPEAVDMDDLDGLCDLIIAAYRDAATSVNAQIAEAMPDLGSFGGFGN